MEFLLDTNIIVHYIRQSEYSKQIDKKYSPLGFENTPVVSAITKGEILSIAFRNNWGPKKISSIHLNGSIIFEKL